MAQQGQRIGEYVLEQSIGRGGFGEVWRARHHMWMDKLVAIKIPTDPTYLRDLQREGAFAPELEHPNIVKAVGFDPYAQVPYLAMEYVPGSSLRPLIEQRKLSFDGSVAVLRQVLTGLEHAHKAGFVHRDIKPENILIHERAFTQGYDAPGTAKITDFGLGVASRVKTGESIMLSISEGNPKSMDLAGTIDYMSPELKAGQQVDGRADLYAVGVVLFELLTGQKPAGSEVPSEVNDKSPKWLDDVFRKAYVRVEKRYAGATDFLAALHPPQAKTRVVAGPPNTRREPIEPTDVSAKPRRCPKCTQPTSRGDQFCIHCGHQLVMQVRRCGVCGGFPELTDRFCVLCGSELNMPVRSA